MTFSPTTTDRVSRSKKSATVARVGAAALGSVVLIGVGAGAASAADSGAIDIGVNVTELPAGALSLTVAPDAQVELTEAGSTGTERQFLGELPQVTISDTRNDAAMPSGDAYWYVTSQLSDFVGASGQPAIAASDSFGWAPRVVSGDATNVSVGDETAPGSAFSDFELLASTFSSVEAGNGVWEMSAGLTLRTPVTVEPGYYASTMTLSLFEE